MHHAMHKQVILVRKDLKLPKGKLAVQVAHAALEAALKGSRNTMVSWLEEGGKKVVVGVADEKELRGYKRAADTNGLKTALITDAGKTFFKEPTTVALAIGPDENSKVNKVIKNLKLL